MKRKLFYLLGILLLLTVTNCSNTDRKKEKEVNIHGTAIVLTNNCIQSDEYAEKTYKLVYYGYIKDTVETMYSFFKSLNIRTFLFPKYPNCYCSIC